MAPGSAREPAGAGDWRARVEPWLAASVALALTCAAAMGPWLRRGARAAAGGLARVVDGIARATVVTARTVPPALAAVEAKAVPALAAVGRCAAAGSGWTVERIARCCPPVARATAGAVGTGVQGLAAVAAAGGRRLAPHLPRRRVVVGAALGCAVLVAGVAVLAHPILRLAARTVDLEDAAPGEAGFPRLDERSTVHAADGSVLAILHGEVDRRVVPLDLIPEHVRHAVITAEDRRFPDHGGYDPEAIVRALGANVRARGVVQGGSTITQQLAKQNYVGDARLLSRKASELVHAVALEQAFPKDELLERYLNQVYFGSGAYGIVAAAEHFFAVPPEQLTVEQAALLAGMIRSPNALDPRSNAHGVEQRRNQVLTAMVDEGYLDAAAAGDAVAHPVAVAPPRAREPAEPHVVEAVKREFLADPTFGDTREARARLLFSGGLTISTSIDPRLQAAAAEAVATHISADAGPTAAIAAVNPVTGQVRALHSGTDFAGEQFSIATQGRRQPGSAFKPFVLAAAMEKGTGMPRSLRGDSPATFAVPGHVEPWRVSNHRGADHGSVTGHEALVRSVNTAFADLILDVGLAPVADVAARVGIDVESALGPEATRGPSIALGGFTHGVSPLDMASAYGTFANAGIHVRPFIIERVVDARGAEVFSRRPHAVQALDEDINAAIGAALQDVVRRGTGTRARLRGWEPMGKTGTSQDNADAWFIGAVPDLSAAVWVGHSEERIPVGGLTGGSLPAPIWRDFMGHALHDVRPVAFRDTERPPDS